MILLDTNVVSEFVKMDPDGRVRAWLNARSLRDCYICTPVVAELRHGAAMLPSGRRRDDLLEWYELLESETFVRRILDFDRRAAHRYAEIRARRGRVGKPISVMDGAIAAIASVHSMTLATRNVRDFGDLEIPLVDPFAARTFDP